jgi:predicted nucleic acid-binding protein
LVISLQVLQEYFAAATRKLGVPAKTAQRKVEVLARGKVVRFTERDVIAAIELHRLVRISFWDAMIVHAARAANVAVLYSEDLGHGKTTGGKDRRRYRGKDPALPRQRPGATAAETDGDTEL